MVLVLRMNESEIPHWAARYVLSQTLRARSWEQTLINRRRRIREAKCMNLNELYDLARWKSRRQSKRVQNNCESDVINYTKDSFACDRNWEKIRILRRLEGISVARASAILHMYDERPYPIVDRYAAWTVNKNEVVINRYTKDFWCEYVELCRELAKPYDNDMRLVDRALMHYGYIHIG